MTDRASGSWVLPYRLQDVESVVCQQVLALSPSQIPLALQKGATVGVRCSPSCKSPLFWGWEDVTERLGAVRIWSGSALSPVSGHPRWGSPAPSRQAALSVRVLFPLCTERQLFSSHRVHLEPRLDSPHGPLQCSQLGFGSVHCEKRLLLT